ncbi:hypothetical protein JOQ06_008783, partial [Pogonophryne albipinna]
LLRVSPCCSAKQPVREAAKLQRGPLPGYPAHPPHLGPCCPSCALRCMHISIMNSKADIFSLGVKRYPLASGSK